MDNSNQSLKVRTPILNKEMLVCMVLLGSFPLWAPLLGLYAYIGVEVTIWMIYALGYNLLLGYTGLPSFGHGAFFGSGAYAYGLAQTSLELGVLPSLGLAILAGGAAAGLVACFVSHRRGIYFALITIACGQVFWFVAMRWRSLTGGEDGLLNIHRTPVSLGFTEFSIQDNESLFFFVITLFAIVMVGLYRLVHSPFGMSLQALRMNETRARFVGHNVWLIKWTVFTISGLLAGLAGGLLAVTQESAYPDVMSLHQSGFIVMMIIIGGGMISYWGPLVGTILFIVARDLLGSVTETWLLWYGLLFMIIIMVQPEGLVGVWRKLWGGSQKKSDNENGVNPLREALGEQK